MTYVIAGVTGHTGRVVAESLLEKGAKVRVVVRDDAKGAPFRSRGAEVAKADLGDAEALTKALEGATAAYLLIPPIPGATDFYAEQTKLADAIATAVARAKVPHVVFLSSIGAPLASGTGPIRGLGYAEEKLRAIDTTRFTFLRPSYFMENFGSALGGLPHGVFPTFLSATRAVPTIATQDIAHAAVRALLEGTKANEVIELAGPAEVTAADVARAFSTAAGKELRLEVGPTSVMAETLVGFGVDRDLARLYAEMTESFNEGRITFERTGRFERGTTPIDTVARTLLGAAG